MNPTNPMNPMNILGTGCAGFIGWKVSECLLREGHRVIGVDNLNDAYDLRLKEWRLAQLEGHPNLSFHRLDITDRERSLGAGGFDRALAAADSRPRPRSARPH